MNIVIDKAIPFIEGVLEPHGNVRYLDGQAISAADVRDADALIIRTRTRCGSALLDGSFVVVRANYRLIPNVEVKDCIDDAAAVVAWAFRHVAEYGGSEDKIFISGHSAGGYLTDMVGLDKHYLAAYGVDADRIAGLVPFSGQVISHFAYRKTLGMGELQPSIDPYAPLYHIRPDAPPIVIVSGDREMELYGRYEETAYFWRMLKLVGHPDVHIYELQGYNHNNMADPAVQILKDHVRRILKTRK